MQPIRKAGLQADVSAGLGNLYLPKWAGRALRLDRIHPKMVPHVSALDPEDHVLRDISGMVGHAFQVARDQQGINPPVSFKTAKNSSHSFEEWLKNRAGLSPFSVPFSPNCGPTGLPAPAVAGLRYTATRSGTYP